MSARVCVSCEGEHSELKHHLPDPHTEPRTLREEFGFTGDEPVCDTPWLVGPADAMCFDCGHRFDAHTRGRASTGADAPPPLDVAVAALQQIKDEEGKVCDQYEICEHRACQSSYGAWAIADAALARLRAEQEGEGR